MTKKEINHIYYLKNKEKIKVRVKNWQSNNINKVRAYKRKFQSTYELANDISLKHQRNNPIQGKARNAIRTAVRNGTIIKLPCFCGIKKTEAHHYLGYEKENWLNIKWLCKLHHEEQHHMDFRLYYK